MSDHLDHLVARARETRPAIRPRLEPLFLTKAATSVIEEPEEQDSNPRRTSRQALEAGPASRTPRSVVHEQPDRMQSRNPLHVFQPEASLPLEEQRPQKKTGDGSLDEKGKPSQQTTPNDIDELAAAEQPPLIVVESRGPAAVFPRVATAQRFIRTTPAPTKNGNATARAPIVRVTIGRIEVRAASQPSPARTAPKPNAPSLTLDAYLKARKEGAR